MGRNDPDIVIVKVPMIFFLSLSNHWKVRGSFLCISVVFDADVWQRCFVRVNDESLRYFMPCLHFFDFSLKVKFGLINNAGAIGILPVTILHNIFLPIVSNLHSTWRDQSIFKLICPSFSDSNDLSLARITPLAAEKITDNETGAPFKHKAETS